MKQGSAARCDEHKPAGLPRRARLAIVLMSAGGLAAQVALTRLLSVVLWYHFAFLVVSTALLGYGLSGAFLARRLGGAAQAISATPLARRGAWIGVVGLLLTLLALRLLPFEPFRLALEPLQFLWALLLQAALVLPFFGAGLTIGALLLSHPTEAGTLYGIDLLGAAGGALGGFFLSAWLGPIAVLGLAAAGAALAAGLLGERPWRVGMAALACAGLGLVFEPILGLRTSADKRLRGTSVSQLLGSEHQLASHWDPASRVDLIAQGDARTVLLDAGAAVVRVPHLLRPWSATPALRDVTALPFFLSPPKEVLVLGAGAGWEVAGALSHGATKVDAVEINSSLEGWLRGPLHSYTRGLIDDPRVHWHSAEARAFLRGSRGQWQSILSIHTISNAAAASGALGLAEDHTLTVEALQEAAERLQPGGWIYITRPEIQLPKLLSTAAEAIRRSGGDPAAQLVALRLPVPQGMSFTSAMLQSQAPLTHGELEAIQAAAATLRMQLLLAPGIVKNASLSAAMHGRGATTLDLSPATDDRPFFSHRHRWTALGLQDLGRSFGAGIQARDALEDAPLAEFSLLLLIVETLGIAAIASLFAGRRRKESGPQEAPSGSTPHRAATPRGSTLVPLLYFGLLGLAFAALELGLVQGLGLLLGSPTLSFAATVFGLLAFTGLGALMSARVERALPPFGVVLLAAAGPCLSLLALWAIEPWLLASTGGVRLAGSFLLLLPAGLSMGLPFPLGLRRSAGLGAEVLGRAWATNGFASVVGSALALVLATGAGLRVLFLAGVCAYLLAALMMVLWPRPRTL